MPKTKNPGEKPEGVGVGGGGPVKPPEELEGGGATPQPVVEEDGPPSSEEPVQVSEVDIIAKQLAELMVSNPDIVAMIADVLESFVSEKEEPSMSLPGGQAPVGPAAAPESSAPAITAPTAPPTAVQQSAQTVDPEMLARLTQIERQMADHEVDRELSRIGGRYGQLRSHFGDVLPEKVEERALLQKVHEIISGKASPFDVALATMLLEQVTSGEGTFRDRILASAANTMQKPPAVEGRGGGVAASEGAPDVSKMSTTELMNYIKNSMSARRGQPS